MSLAFSTDEVDRTERVEHWREMVTRHFLALRVEPQHMTSFSGSATLSSIGDLDVARVRAAPMAAFRTQRHIDGSAADEYLLALHLRGVAVTRQQGRQAVLRAGEFALLDSARPYWIEFRGEGRFDHLIIRIPRAQLEARCPAPDRATSIAVDRQSDAGQIAAPALRTLATRPSATAFVDPVLELLARALSERAGLDATPEWRRARELRELKRRLLHHLADADLSPASAAASASISTRQLHRLFATGGETFGEFVRNARLRGCRRDLLDPELTSVGIAEIAVRWGFRSPAHFSRSFALSYGLAPGELRRQAALTVRR